MIGFQKLAKNLRGDLGAGKLISVSLIHNQKPRTEDMPPGSKDLVALFFKLEHCEFYCLAKHKNDQIEIQFTLPFEEVYISEIDMTSRKPWAELVGIELFNIWALQTDVGDYDALQLSFGTVDDPKNLSVQLEAEGAGISISTLKLIDWTRKAYIEQG